MTIFCYAVEPDVITFPGRCVLVRGHEGKHRARQGAGFDEVTWGD